MSQKIAPDITAVMYRPVLIRAGIALIFGIATFIIQEPTDAVVNYGATIFFLFSGSAMWEYLRREPVPEGMRTPLSLVAAVWMLAALTLVGVQLGGLSQTVTWAVIAAGLGLSGVAELWAFSWQKTFAPARDHLIAGITGVVMAILLITLDVDYHRIFGITGTYALITGVLFGITGLGYWLDTRKAIKEDGFQPPAP
ncbi:hypothetical protein [Enteractinococcus helveticum]|uniref:DUF308 domain-containing protein n=1 Tax=Enteractinococcus helveticum TaxID=1837282 RepID=A0A1B7M3A3_9MICC|nr:hypothetical protein [Enteractinococcus helveticum]OAV63055.1 hypothetical protein A6F49_03145 [Enteractinococcus helveticum]